MKSRIFLYFAIVSVVGMLAISGCHRDDDEQNDRNDRNGSLNGHNYVDLGLPSGTRWATCNVGANNPEEYGDYFAWGETTTKDLYDYDTYIYDNGSENGETAYTKYTRYDGLTTLQSSDDAATANWGSGWRMPTPTEMQELYRNTTQESTNQNGVIGVLFTGFNGNSIFLPLAGYSTDSVILNDGWQGKYWSSSLTSSDYYHYGESLLLESYEIPTAICYTYGYYRHYGFTIRPVCNR